MELTWLGFVLIPLGLLTYLAFPNRLAHLAIFFIPFTASSVLNSSSDVPLSPFQLFGSMFILHRMLVTLWSGRLRISPKGDKSIILFLLFAGIAAASMVMPYIIDGSLEVSSNQLNNLYAEPLKLTDSNMKLPLPVVMGTLFAISLASTLRRLEAIVSALRIYIVSAMVVSAWGIFQFLCNAVFQIEYPYYLFNNVKLDSVQGYLQGLQVGDDLIPRVSSVTHEASIFSKYLLTAIPVVSLCFLMKTPLMGKGKDALALLLMCTALLVTTSAIGYLGLILGMMICALLSSTNHIAKLSALSIVASLVLLSVGLVIVVFPGTTDVLISATVEKGGSGSFLERMLSIAVSWGYFLEYPILGIGWGITTSHDLIVNLLANTGLIGLASFSGLMIYIIRNGLKDLRSFPSATGNVQVSLFPLKKGLIASLILLILTGMLSGLEFYLGYFYFVCAMLIAVNTVESATTPRLLAKRDAR